MRGKHRDEKSFIYRESESERERERESGGSSKEEGFGRSMDDSNGTGF